MSKVEKIEQEVQGLSPAELAEFRAWFLEYDSGGVRTANSNETCRPGRLDDLAEKALRDHAAGKTHTGL